MKKKSVRKYIDMTFGFPIHVPDAPLRMTVGGWVLDIAPHILERALLLALPHKPVPLSGNEIRFIRLHFEMTLEEFGRRFDVSHAAASKWEKAKDRPTKMNWATEKDIRLFILSKISKKNEVADAYEELETKPDTRPGYQPVEVQI